MKRWERLTTVMACEVLVRSVCQERKGPVLGPEEDMGRGCDEARRVPF